MVLASLDDPSFGQMIANSNLIFSIPGRLENLFNAIPAHVDPNEIDGVDVTWGLDSPAWTKEKKFSGCRQVAAFFMWFDYCNQLIREAYPDVADALAKSIKVNFFEKIVTPALAEHHVVLITALVTKCLKELTSAALCTGVWILSFNCFFFSYKVQQFINCSLSLVTNRSVGCSTLELDFCSSEVSCL